MTAVEWLVEKYNYVTWLRNRDEISPETADEMRKRYLEQANQMHKEQIIKAWIDAERYNDSISKPLAEKYYNETYGKE